MPHELHRSDGECFRFLSLVFDVSKARNLLLARKRPPKVEVVRVADVERLLSRKLPNGTLAIGVGVDWDRVKKDAKYDLEEAVFDTTVPLIMARTEHGIIPIDGWHRIARATLVGPKNLPCYLLTKKESAAVRLDWK